MYIYLVCMYCGGYFVNISFMYIFYVSMGLCVVIDGK